MRVAVNAGRGAHAPWGVSCWDQDTAELRGPKGRLCTIHTRGCECLSRVVGKYWETLSQLAQQHGLIEWHPDADASVPLAEPRGVAPRTRTVGRRVQLGMGWFFPTDGLHGCCPPGAGVLVRRASWVWCFPKGHKVQAPSPWRLVGPTEVENSQPLKSGPSREPCSKGHRPSCEPEKFLGHRRGKGRQRKQDRRKMHFKRGSRICCSGNNFWKSSMGHCVESQIFPV